MNVGFISEWYNADSIDLLLDILQPGDLLEFDRTTYKHWAVYVGWREECKTFCLIHRAGLTDNSSSSLFIAGSIHSTLTPLLPEGTLSHIGAVRLNTVIEILGSDRVRINNKNDYVWNPLRGEQVVENAEIGLAQQLPYHTFTNNCEHFANKCRYGHACSHQVQALIAGATTAAFLLAPMVTLGSAIGYMLFHNRRKKENP